MSQIQKDLAAINWLRKNVNQENDFLKQMWSGKFKKLVGKVGHADAFQLVFGFEKSKDSMRAML